MAQKFNKLFYFFAPVIFICMLLLPLLVNNLKSVSGITKEQRSLAALPRFTCDSAESFPKQFEAYYNDNFGLRARLVNLGAWIKYHGFNSSAKPEKVLIGKSGWLFLSGRFYGVTQDINRENLYSKDSLYKLARQWEERKKSLKELNINYYKAFWPDKYYIYPEYLPTGMQLANKKSMWRCDQAIQYLKSTKSTVNIIDVRQPLLAEKALHRVYYKFDSHWNDYGAFIGYSQLVNTIANDYNNIKPLSLMDYELSWKENDYGDLSEILNLAAVDTCPVFIKKGAPANIEKVSSEKIKADGFPKKTLVYINHSNPNAPVALIYRDSYTDALIPFLTQHFSQTVLIWDTEYSTDMVEKVKPNLVIECYASRYFR